MGDPQQEKLVATLGQLQAGLNDLEAQRVTLISARRKVLAKLHREYGMPMRVLGKLCGMTATAVLRNIEAFDAEQATEQVKARNV